MGGSKFEILSGVETEVSIFGDIKFFTLPLKLYIVYIIPYITEMSYDDENYDDFEDMDGTLFDGLSELERLEAEEEMLSQAFNNSYGIITNSVTFDELLEINGTHEGGYTTLAHDIEAGPTKKDLENIIVYFQEKEEYEKCAVIHKMLSE